MKRIKGIKAPMQVGIEDFKGIFQDRVRAMVRQGVLDLIAREVTDLCGEIHRPDGGIYRRGGTETVTIRTSSGKEGIDVLAIYLDGVFLGKERCVVVALAIDTKGCKHLLDFEEDSSKSAEAGNVLLGKLAARGLVVGKDRRVLVLRDGSAAIAKAVSRFWPDAVQQERGWSDSDIRYFAAGANWHGLRNEDNAWCMWSGCSAPSSPTSTSAGLWSG